MAKKNDASKKSPVTGKLNESKKDDTKKRHIGDTKKKDTDDTGPRDKK